MNNLITFFKLLSDETRLRIMILLYHKKLCVCEICGILNESQPKVSKHLAKLRDIGIITDEKQEQFVFYSLKQDNKLFLDILKGIIDKVDEYEVLGNDLKQCINAERFIEKKMCGGERKCK